MNAKRFLWALSITLIGSAFTFISAINWQVKEDEYAIKFDTKGASGTISGFKGAIQFDEKNLPASAFNVTLDVNTLNTGNGMKNKHAKADGFLDAEKYPLIEYTSSKIEKTDNGYISTGKLKIKGISKDVSIPFTFIHSGTEGAFKGNFEINRLDYDLKKMGVGEVIKIELVIPVKK